MEKLTPFLTRFARMPREHEPGNGETDGKQRQEENPTKAVSPPPPTMRTRVNGETTDDT